MLPSPRGRGWGRGDLSLDCFTEHIPFVRKHSVNPFHPHLTSTSRGRRSFLPSHFWEGSGEGIAKGALPNTGSLKPYLCAGENQNVTPFFKML